MGLDAPAVEDRGTLLLLVDESHAEALAGELAQLNEDLIGDGWKVIRHDVRRETPVRSIKSLIVADYRADSAKVKAVFLLGHVPVPYAGDFAPDGHADHTGAWPADSYYAGIDGLWTDETVDVLSR